VADGRLHELRQRLGEWFSRKQVLRAARAHLPRHDEPAGRAFEQARLLREIARQVAEPYEELPPGRRTAVLLTLYRDLVFWALVAERNTDMTASDLASAWREETSDRLLRAAASDENLAAVRGLLIDRSQTASLDATDEEVDRVRGFADKLYQDLEVPRRRVGRILIQRWLRLAALGAVVLAIVLGIRSIGLGPNLAMRRPFHTSSTLPECAAGGEGCSDVMFHTREENNPWVEFDLGKPTTIHRIDVTNRSQCCEDRAVPLIAEVSKDRVHWKEVARRDTEFSTWTAKLPPTPAIYVRLRVPRVTYLHLVDVVIR
jgi:hypothetical protein